MSLHEVALADSVVVASQLFADYYNLSFETASANQGEAAQWTKSIRNRGTAIGVANCTATSWDPQESFDKGWRLPYLVHQVADGGNSSSAPLASGEAAAIVLANDIKNCYNAHRKTIGSVHMAADAANALNYYDATSLGTAITLANAAKVKLNLHFRSWPRAHCKADSQNEVTAPDATEITSLEILLNQMQAAYNAHLSLTGFGPYNESGKMAFAADDVQCGLYHGDIPLESFEFDWGITDLFPTPAEQAEQVTVDDPAVSWPIGHVELLNNWDNIDSEKSLLERFSTGWLLPGADADWPNEKFLARYWDAENEEWTFPPGWLETPGIELFQTGWAHNDEGYVKYYDEVEECWRFLPSVEPATRQIFGSGFGEYTFATVNGYTGAITYDSAMASGYSPMLQLRYTGLSTDASYAYNIGITFKDKDGVSHTAYHNADHLLWPVTTLATITSFSLLPRDDGQYPFHKYWNGAIEVTSVTLDRRWPGLAFVLEGTKGYMESFESDWILTLD